MVKKSIVEEAVRIANTAKGSRANYSDTENSPIHRFTDSPALSTGVIEVKEIKNLKAGIVITGNEVYYGRIKDAFAPVVTKKMQEHGCEIVGIYYAPDDEALIEARLRELVEAGAELLITTGGMSVDPDDVTRFAIRKLGAGDIVYGSAALPGAMFLVAYLNRMQDRGYTIQDKENHASCIMNHTSLIPILGIPACGMYHKTTIFDLILPRVLAGEIIGRKELAELGHGGLCLNCKTCSYPICPFGK